MISILFKVPVRGRGEVSFDENCKELLDDVGREHEEIAGLEIPKSVNAAKAEFDALTVMYTSSKDWNVTIFPETQKKVRAALDSYSTTLKKAQAHASHVCRLAQRKKLLNSNKKRRDGNARTKIREALHRRRRFTRVWSTPR